MGSLEGLDNDRLGLLRSRATPQPFGTFTRPLKLNNPAREALPKLGILCSLSLAQVQEMISSDDPVFRQLASPSWRFVELPTGHWPMFSRPEDLAGLLLDIPSDDIFALIVAVVSFVVLQKFRVPIYLMVPVGAVVGMVWTLL
jgi:hypothetical protein